MLNIFKGIHTGALPALTKEEAELSQNLRKRVDVLAMLIGDRNIINSPKNLDLAGDSIEADLKHLAYTPDSQSYRVTGKLVRNIDAELRGIEKPDEIIVIGAHYDSIAIPFGCPGANDNASGVAATLEIARLLASQRLRRTTRFVAFVNEEPPYFQTADMGSLVYAQRCRERNEKIIGMITPETIGCYSDVKGTQSFPFPLNLAYPTVGNFIAFVGNGASSELVSRVTRTFRQTTQFPAVGFAAPSWVTQAGWSDHWSFWKHGYQGLMMTDTAPLRYRHYHTRQDTPDKMDFDRMARVVTGLTRVVTQLAEA
jgi:Zn-dependent M28 family amino/carboxypeptidase